LPALKGKAPEDFLYPKYRFDLNTRLKAACKRAGVRVIRLHDLRHICGSNLVMKSGPAVAQAVLRHATIGTTVDIYSHLPPSFIASEMEKSQIEPLLEKAMKLAMELSGASDPTTAELVTVVRKIWHVLARGHEKGTYEDDVSPCYDWWAMPDLNWRLLPCEARVLWSKTLVQ